MEYYKFTAPQKNIRNVYKFYNEYGISNIGGVMLFEGTLDIAVCAKTINYFIENNNSIRVRVKKEYPENVMYLEDYKEYLPECIDLTKFECPDEKLNEMFRVPFNVYDNYLFEFKIVKYDIKRMGYFLRLHHLIGDGFSIGLICSQFIEIYNSIVNDAVPKIPKSSFVDFARYEKEYMSSDRLAIDKKFWDSRMTVFSKIGRDTKKPKSKRETFTLGKEKSNLIKEFCKKNNVSVPVLFKAVLLFYIARINNTSLPVIAISALGRTSKQKHYIGNFALTLPLSAEISYDDSFQDICNKVKSETFNIYKHQQYPYDRLSIDSSLEVLFSFQTTSIKNSQGYTTKWLSNGFCDAKLFINIDDRDNTEQFGITFEYRAEAFDSGEINLIMHRLDYILTQLIEKFECTINDINIIPQKEMDILEEMNRTESEYPDININELIKRNVTKNPCKTAFIYDDKSITFEEMEKRSNYLAVELLKENFKKGDIVALISERSIELMIAIQAVVKIGCAYLPIERTTPHARVDYILKNSGARLYKIPEYIGSVENVELPSIDMETNVYVMYTSGSTGEPKGVAVTHRCLVNRINWMNKITPLLENDIILHKTSISFDVSVWEIFWGSIYGVTTCILPQGMEKYPQAIIDYISKYKITRLHFVPSMLKAFTEYVKQNPSLEDDIITLTNVYSSGEELTSRHVERFYEILNAKLYNLYGPTECTIDVTYFKCKNEKYDYVPIGYPVDNTKIYILDETGRTQPIGITGELCVGGIQVAQGYLNNSALSEKSFVLRGDERIYKTGDMAFINVKGEVIYKGRRDTLVKIRGQRVELSEIETKIRNFKGISYAVVLFQHDILCAWYTSDIEIDKGHLQKYLSKFLPQYMIPVYIEHIDEIPCLPNGKSDKSKLVIPKINERTVVKAYTEKQRVFVDIIKEILSQKKYNINVGIEDNLFEIGISSIDVITAAVKLEKQGIKVNAEDFYANLTIKNILDSKNDVKLVNQIKSGNFDTATICIPYAGGGFGVFKDIAPKLNTDVFSIETSLFNINDTYAEKADKIIKLIPKEYSSYNIIGYCTGSGLAAQLTSAFENKGHKVSGLILCGSIIPAFVSLWGKYLSPWDFITENYIMRILNMAGGNEVVFPKSTILTFKKDARIFFKCMPKSVKGLQARITCIYASEDVFTRGYKRSHKRWNKFFGKTVTYEVVNSGNHYFALLDNSIIPQIINNRLTHPDR